MRPLFLAAARPMNVEWKMRPYFGVFPLVFSALIHRTEKKKKKKSTTALMVCLMHQFSDLERNLENVSFGN